MVVAARAEVLRRVRVALGGDAAADAAVIGAEWEALPRGYRRAASLGREGVLELLEDRLRDYDAVVVRVKAGEVGAAIGRMLTERGKRRLVVPVGLEEALRADGNPPFADGAKDGPPGFVDRPHGFVAGVSEGVLPEGFEFVVDEGLSAAELDGFEGVVTASTVAIAETGTIVLQVVAGQGRRAATLVPDYHLCVVRGVDVVETVPEAMARLAASATVATTFVSGPSATADIEMTRIKGVHGPRFLDVILVG
jgi:L-lactate dehydrogenase complex protein LldG